MKKNVVIFHIKRAADDMVIGVSVSVPVPGSFLQLLADMDMLQRELSRLLADVEDSGDHYWDNGRTAPTAPLATSGVPSRELLWIVDEHLADGRWHSLSVHHASQLEREEYKLWKSEVWIHAFLFRLPQSYRRDWVEKYPGGSMKA